MKTIKKNSVYKTFLMFHIFSYLQATDLNKDWTNALTAAISQANLLEIQKLLKEESYGKAINEDHIDAAIKGVEEKKYHPTIRQKYYEIYTVLQKRTIQENNANYDALIAHELLSLSLHEQDLRQEKMFEEYRQYHWQRREQLHPSQNINEKSKSDNSIYLY